MARNTHEDLIMKGLKLYEQKEYAEGWECFQRALDVHGGYDAVACYWLAIMAKDVYLAIQLLLRGVASLEDPDNEADEQTMYKSCLQLGASYLAIGVADKAKEFYHRAYVSGKSLKDKTAAFSGYLMALVADSTPLDELTTALREYDCFVAQYPRKPLPARVRRGRKITGRKIRLAYISPDFCNHVLYAFYYPLLKHYDREKFHVICIAANSNSDAMTEAVREMADEFIDASQMSYRDMAALVRQMQLDILVELAGHSANTCLPILSYRLALVQISGLGWMESTGSRYVDYLITDRYVDPEDSAYLTEKPLYLTSQFCYTVHRKYPKPAGAPCRRNGYVTFGVFNRLVKFTPEIVVLWLSIMKAVPTAKLLLKGTSFSTSSVLDDVRGRFARIGFDVDRLIIEEPSVDYMERYLDVDIALDTYPWTGGGTTFDALYMGVPVVSMYGERRSSRFGLSILSNAGVGELAVASSQEYVERAVALAEDRAALDILHESLRVMLLQSPAMDAGRYVAEMEAHYERILAEAKGKR